ncbi:MAG: transcription termination/antitermination protein NusA, partial [Marinicaulis sp.]|nr:transcription termination/antitermination protein NusA [Marinicaulis sp.]
MNAISANKLELIQIADAVAREKSIEKSLVIEAMEDALARAARSRYGHETNVKAEINPQTGEMKLWRLLEVVETIENDAAEIALSEALHRNPGAEVGDFMSEPLPPIAFGRVAAMAAKLVITQKVREA